EDAEAAATEDELTAERTASSSQVTPFEHRRPARKPFPAHLPRERVVIAAPAACPCCGTHKLSKLGESLPPGLTRGRSRDAGDHPSAMESDPDGARALLAPSLRDDRAAASAVPFDSARAGRAELVGD